MTNPKPSGFNIELPANLEPVYSNFAVITHSPSEVIIDLAQTLPNQPAARIKARVILTPLNAKLLLRALQDNLAKYEARFGEIAIPGDADDLTRAFFGPFRPTPGGENP